MNMLLDSLERRSCPACVEGEPSTRDGKREVEEFERLKDAYDPRLPATGERMIEAFLKFQQLGHSAYFLGERVAPPEIAARPQLAEMWSFGYDVAECEAATRRCACQCDKTYVRGQGYGTCPRIPQTSQNLLPPAA